ncbi:pseudouridine synthase [Corynebacterium lizhenjunii]|uniref:pseudouridine synthase n=1 Tax=Corynebacterium lizhenjunii TaxID=2709394 RepID=UPI0013EABCCB|nr:pseudouridine synthase [Corynebacterium lizhenjunii]
MTAPIPWEKKLINGSRSALKSMRKRIVQRGKGYSPLPIKDGLNPTRARVPDDFAPAPTAWDFVWHLISTQRHRHPDDGPAALQARFASGSIVLADATPLSPHSILTPGTDVYFYRTPAPEEPVPYDIPVLYEDEDILVADKPPFMATMPRASHIVETATVRLRRATGIDELSPVHRLDRLTSGVLLFTKHRAVRGAYQTLFSQRRVHKTYQAIAAYGPFDTPLQWESRIEKSPGEIQGRLVDGPINAITTLGSVTPLSASEQNTFEAIHGPQPPLARYVLHPATGKTHQLRLHMWCAGVPILGDPVYPTILPAEDEDMTIPMHLLAKRIEFADPLSGQPRAFVSNGDWSQP